MKKISDEEMAAGFAEGARRRAAAFKHLCDTGKLFTGIRRPRGYRQRRAGECFGNAQILALEDRGTYVEGVCVTPLRIPIHHGWITLDGVHAIDPTLPHGERCFYFGITFDRVEIANSMVQNKVCQAQLDLESIVGLPPQLRDMIRRERTVRSQ
jgi:hypothetical protein